MSRKLSDAEKAILGAAAVAEINNSGLTTEPSTETNQEQTQSNEVEQLDTEESQPAGVESEGAEDTQQLDTVASVDAGVEKTVENTELTDKVPEVEKVDEVQPSVETSPAPVSVATAQPTVEVPHTTIVEAPEKFGPIGQRVMSVLTSYADKMAPRKPVSDAVILEQQRLLFDALMKTINDSGNDFENLLTDVFAFFEQNKNGVFFETRIFRGMDNVQLSQDERAAFTRILNLFKLVANPQSRGIALKQVDLHASLQYGVTEYGKNRLLSYFNQ